jgi:hypothetical protein
MPMTASDVTAQSMHIYRVDKFVVPVPARDEFLHRVKKTHGMLKVQPGFLQDTVLEQVAGNGVFNFVTIVEWESQASVENAKAAVTSLYQQTNFNPQEMFDRLGIKADLANYRRVDA